MLTHYQQVLDELREKNRKLASEYINELYLILKEEESLSPEECRSKIESDCSDIWSEDTIRKYLPPEAKNKTKRKAGKISAELKKLKKAKERAVKEEAKPLVVVNSGSRSSSGQMSALISSCSSNSRHDINDSVGFIPTENASVGQPGNVLTEDYFSSLIAERLKDEVLEELENSSTGDQCMNRFLLLPSELAVQIYSDVNASRGSEIIPEFELEHDGIRILSVRMSKSKLQETAQKLMPNTEEGRDYGT